ncbi:MAG: SseB family protein [Bacillota bacterium]|nr:SseB family protein [Bacillota bacterium]
MKENKGGKIIEASFGKAESPYTTGCRALEDALHAWHADGVEKEPTEVVDVLFDELMNGLEVIVPVAYEDGEMMMQIISSEDDSNWMSCFTNNEEKNKGETTSSGVMEMTEVMERALSIEICNGIAINPWGEGVFVPKELIMSMLKEIEANSQDSKDVQSGIEAYIRGDYEEALNFFQKAEENDSVMATGRIGLCYYLGRGVQKDVNRARSCWEKAAIYGDALSICRLADMCMKGEIQGDDDYAEKLYHKAFQIACDNPDIWSFPDIALRMLRYYRDDLGKDVLINLVNDVVGCYDERIQMGDITCAMELYEAEQILKELE